MGKELRMRTRLDDDGDGNDPDEDFAHRRSRRLLEAHNPLRVMHTEAGRSGDNNANLRAKRSWDTALAPIKQAPMNLFIMYMSGNTISIFPIMMVVMMAVRPFKTLLSMSTTFKTLDGDTGSTSALGQKIVFVLGNLANVALAVYKFNSMGLLPTYASDWLAFADPISRVEWAYVAT